MKRFWQGGAAALVLLEMSVAAKAQDDLKAQPIIPMPPVGRAQLALAATVGTEQSDFFFTENRTGDYVVFSADGAVVRGRQTRSLFSLRMTNGIDTYYPGVTARSPLRRLINFSLAPGAPLDGFISSHQEDTVFWREVFHVPGRGLYQSVSAGVPTLIKPETAASPIRSAAVRYSENALNTADDTPATKEHRVVFSAPSGRLGSVPFESQGTGPTSVLMRDAATYPKIVTNGDQYTTWKDEVYFVGTNPATGGPDIYTLNVALHGRAVTYKTSNVTTGTTSTPQQLSGGSAGLFYTTLDAGAAHSRLVVTDDGQNFYNVTDGDGNPAGDATQITQTIDSSYADMGFSARDPVTGAVRFATFFDTLGAADGYVVYPELPGFSAGSTTDPQRIVSTGNDYYFSGAVSGSRYLCRYFTGGDELERVRDSAGNNLLNPGEIVNVTASSDGGTLYFLADDTIGGVSYSGILFTMDADAEPPVATPCRTPGGNYIVGAHNLRPVAYNASPAVYRCYFCAPVNPTQNAEFAGGKDYGTKPFVVSTP